MEQETQPTETPKPSKKQLVIQRLFMAIALFLTFLGIDHYTFNWISGGATVTVTDSTIVVKEVSPTDTTKPIYIDTTKKDTVKK